MHPAPKIGLVNLAPKSLYIAINGSAAARGIALRRRTDMSERSGLFGRFPQRGDSDWRESLSPHISLEPILLLPLCGSMYLSHCPRNRRRGRRTVRFTRRRTGISDVANGGSLRDGQSHSQLWIPPRRGIRLLVNLGLPIFEKQISWKALGAEYFTETVDYFVARKQEVTRLHVPACERML